MTRLPRHRVPVVQHKDAVKKLKPKFAMDFLGGCIAVVVVAIIALVIIGVQASSRKEALRECQWDARDAFCVSQGYLRAHNRRMNDPDYFQCVTHRGKVTDGYSLDVLDRSQCEG